MDGTEGHGELEPIGTTRDHPFNEVGAKLLIVKLLYWASSSDVL